MWRKVEIDGFIPPSRDGHTAVIWNNQMFVFGGFEEDSQRFSQETYVFDFGTATWREMHTKNTPPLWRDFHTASVIDGVMYIFGGRSDHNGQVGDEHLVCVQWDWHFSFISLLNPSGMVLVVSKQSRSIEKISVERVCSSNEFRGFLVVDEWEKREAIHFLWIYWVACFSTKTVGLKRGTVGRRFETFRNWDISKPLRSRDSLVPASRY